MKHPRSLDPQSSAREPTRWRELETGASREGGPAPGASRAQERELRAGRLAREVPEPTLPHELTMEAIGARIALRRGPRARPRRAVLVAAAAALLICGAVLGAAAHSWMSRRREGASVAASLTAGPRAGSPPSGAAPAPRALREASPAEGALPRRAPETLPARARAPRETPPPSPAAPSPPASPPAARALPLPPASEARALGLAVQRLRRERDPRGALRALDDYALSFPLGRLRAEAGLLRVEALLSLGERLAALTWLEGHAPEAGPRARELLLLRGELRAGADRCAEAVQDLGRALATASTEAHEERALFARASCLTRLHRFAEARADLETYGRRFPRGAHAAEAARILRSLGDEP